MYSGRPRDRRATESTNELATPHIDHLVGAEKGYETTIAVLTCHRMRGRVNAASR
jgi:hypothetical protein